MVPVEALKKGHCLSHQMEEGDVSGRVKVVPCAQRHAHEVYAVFTLPAGGGFPGDRKAQGAADSRCVRAFRTYVGIAYDDSALDLSYLYPNTAEKWRQDRRVVCMLDSAHPRRGSDAGSRH